MHEREYRKHQKKEPRILIPTTGWLPGPGFDGYQSNPAIGEYIFLGFVVPANILTQYPIVRADFLGHVDQAIGSGVHLSLPDNYPLSISKLRVGSQGGYGACVGWYNLQTKKYGYADVWAEYEVGTYAHFNDEVTYSPPNHGWVKLFWMDGTQQIWLHYAAALDTNPNPAENVGIYIEFALSSAYPDGHADPAEAQVSQRTEGRGQS